MPLSNASCPRSNALKTPPPPPPRRSVGLTRSFPQPPPAPASTFSSVGECYPVRLALANENFKSRTPAATPAHPAHARCRFSSAHFTIFSDGSRERLHGHNFTVAVDVQVVAAARRVT